MPAETLAASPVADPFWDDLERLIQIRRAHQSARPNPAENPAWANTHNDVTFLLGFLDNLWNAYQRAQSKIMDLDGSAARLMAEVGGNSKTNAGSIPAGQSSSNTQGSLGGVAAPGKVVPGAESAGSCAPDSRLEADAPDHRRASSPETRHSERSEPVGGVTGNAGAADGSSFLIGMSIEDAMQALDPDDFLVASVIDGRPQMLTANVNMRRIRVEIEGRKITHVRGRG